MTSIFDEQFNITKANLWASAPFNVLRNTQLNTITIFGKSYNTIASYFKSQESEEDSWLYNLWNGDFRKSPHEILEKAILSTYATIVTLDKICTKAISKKINLKGYTIFGLDVNISGLWSGSYFRLMLNKDMSNTKYGGNRDYYIKLYLTGPVTPGISISDILLSTSIQSSQTFKLSDLTPDFMADLIEENAVEQFSF